nr:DivIVA domain-containing protein [Streptomyces apocyni]
MFWFLLIALVVVVAAVALAVLGGGESAPLQDAAPELVADPLPAGRPVGWVDVQALRLPMVLRGYRMADVDDALDRLGAELAERDARIAELEAALAGSQATAVSGPGLFDDYSPQDAVPGPADGPAAGSASGPASGSAPEAESGPPVPSSPPAPSGPSEDGQP